MGKKNKKEKITYIDDGRTIADMSGVQGPRLSRDAYRPRVNPKDAWNTYWNAVKKMFGPMMIVIVALGVIYMVLYFVFFFMY